MEEAYISISTLNDFIFCPYSIYLRNVYMENGRRIVKNICDKLLCFRLLCLTLQANRAYKANIISTIVDIKHFGSLIHRL